MTDPCESDNPPDYCDEAGSCFDKEFENELDGKIIRGLEDKGALNELWKKSNADAADQSTREERGGWIVSTDDGYKLVEFGEVESDITHTPLGIKGVNPENRPSGTVATFHTQPFKSEEIITDTEVIKQYLLKIEENPANYDLEELADPYAGKILRYPSEPTVGDFGTSATTQMRGYLIDGENIFSFGGYDEDGDGELEEGEGTIETTNSRCGY